MDNVQIQQVEQTVRFQHPEKLLTTVPRLDEPVIATILGLDVATYRETKHQLEEQVRWAAHELLTDPAFADSVDRLPFRPGTMVVGIGDSNTDDLLSWLEILRCLLELRRPQDRIRVLNAAVAAQTTSMALTRLSGIVTLRPAWIICALGSADALRGGPQPAKTLVSPEETAWNVAEMRHMAMLQTEAHCVWMTPPTVDERITAKYPPFQQAQLMLQNKDIRAVGDILRSQLEPVVDVQAMFGYPAAQEFVGPNGPTPSLTGQQTIANPLNSAAFGPAQLARNEAFFRVGLAAMKGTKLVATDGSQMRSWCLAWPTISCGAKPHPRGGSRQQMGHERVCGSSSSPWSC